jgi:hypothetical protein
MNLPKVSAANCSLAPFAVLTIKGPCDLLNIPTSKSKRESWLQAEISLAFPLSSLFLFGYIE